MYMTIKETAEYLGMPVEQVQKICMGRSHSCRTRWRTIFHQSKISSTLISHELETLKKQIEDYLNEPIPPDRDIKDED